ncbi:MAG: helix-turn-helix domain-containing protein [Paracoccaceae bacterium]
MDAPHKLDIKAFGDVVSKGCPVRVAANILDGKWTTRIAMELLGGKKRFSQLQHALDGISPKILTTRLNMLIENGLVNKTIYPVMPPKTEYELTDLGQNLRDIIFAMAEFGRLVSDGAGRQV